VCRPCTTNSTASGSCQAGYNGTAYRSVTTNSCAGSTTYGNWDYSQCVIACTSNNWSESAACPSGYNGTQYRTNTTNSCSGTAYGAWDTSGCTVACTNSTWTEAGSCQASYTGSAYRSVTRNECTGSVTYGAWNYSGCSYSPSCPAGSAWNGSACAPLPSTCTQEYRISEKVLNGCSRGGASSETVYGQTFETCTYSDGYKTTTALGGRDSGSKQCGTGKINWY
jgi:hypothetical protein